MDAGRKTDRWASAVELAAKTHPSPRTPPALAGGLGFVLSYVAITIFALIADVPISTHPLAAVVACGLAFAVPFISVFLLRRSHLAAAQRAYEHLTLVAENDAARRARLYGGAPRNRAPSAAADSQK